MLVPAWSPPGPRLVPLWSLRVGVSAPSNRKDDVFINRSRHRYTPRNLPAGQFSQPAPRVAPLRQQVGSLAAQVRPRANTIIWR